MNKLHEKPQIAYSECCTLPFVSLYNEDCIETMKRIPDGSIDLMLTDTPYNTTNCDWEYKINLQQLWNEWERILKPNGIWAIFCNEPFTSDLIMSRRDFFKYKWIWDKDSAAGFLNAYKMPLTGYEEIVIFSRAKMGNHTYNPQITDKAKNLVRPPKTDGKEYSATYNKFKSLSREKDTSKAEPDWITQGIDGVSYILQGCRVCKGSGKIKGQCSCTFDDGVEKTIDITFKCFECSGKGIVRVEYKP